MGSLIILICSVISLSGSTEINKVITNKDFKDLQGEMMSLRRICSSDKQNIEELQKDFISLKDLNIDLIRQMNRMRHEQEALAEQLREVQTHSRTYGSTSYRKNVVSTTEQKTKPIPSINKELNKGLIKNSRFPISHGRIKRNGNVMMSKASHNVTFYSPTFHLLDHWHGKQTFVKKNKVAFTARLSLPQLNILPEFIIQFDEIITNIGNSYDNKTGVFTCSIAGIYLFTWSTFVTSRDSVLTDIEKNGEGIGLLNVGSTQDGRNTGSMTVIIHLDIGDKVLVRISAGRHDASKSLNSMGTTFSGFLIY